MTCQHCQTWILDDDHRCRRCGRRVRNTPARISPETYPIAATATAPAYDYNFESSPVTREAVQAEETAAAQQALFAGPLGDPRVIPFDSLTSPVERERIRTRAAEAARPAPLKAERIEAPRGRAKTGAKRVPKEQRHLEFLDPQQVLAHPESSIICDAPIAPATLRMRAALVDTILVALGCAVAAALFKFLGVQVWVDRHSAPFVLLALAIIPFSYKLLWTFAGRDTIGMRNAGLQLVDFDGNAPSQARRYQRLFGTLLSFLAVGLGLIWVLVDEDGLTWHDHISSTFPTIVADD
jgi:uncharacterized RDD family membrane protein YckC